MSRTDIALEIIDWQALAPGLASPEAWLDWAKSPYAIDASAPISKCVHLNPMIARRLNDGSRLAVECGLQLLARHPSIRAVVFASRHGELERNLRLHQALAKNVELSPTDFAMSVHNAAVGTLTICAKQALISSSVSAEFDTFQQALYEVFSLQQGHNAPVLLVDFECTIPEFYLPYLSEVHEPYPYACAFVLGSNPIWHIHPNTSPQPVIDSALPQSLSLLQQYLAGNNTFHLPGVSCSWMWQRSLTES